MILADKIMEERKKNGWSQEELADRLGVSRQAVSKWESAGSVPDLQRVIQLADLFGVSTDYLLKDEMLPEVPQVYSERTVELSSPLRRVSMEEANAFLQIKREIAPIIANAVTMCILSPVLLIVLSTMAEDGVFQISEAFANGIGLASLFGLIAVAVFLFITSGMRGKHFEFLEKECFETEYGVSGMVRERSSAFENTYTRSIAIGVVLFIVAAVPLTLTSVYGASDHVTGIGVGILFLMVAAGVNIIIRVCMVKNSYDTLLQEGDHAQSEKQKRKAIDPFSQAYWSLATAIYLGWSFWTMRWEMTWILWPVAGVLYAAVEAILPLVVKEKE